MKYKVIKVIKLDMACMHTFLDKYFPFDLLSSMLFTSTSAIPVNFCFLLINGQ